jgi:hypothetical protein
MSKLSIPNQPGHYEGSGIEVNVFATQIVVTTHLESTQTREVKQEKVAAKKSSTFGPLTSKLLGLDR